MAQYKAGTVAVTNGGATVVGTGTAFLANVAAGQTFIVNGSKVPYIVSSVVDNTHLTLSAPYAGATQSGLNYEINTSRTPVLLFDYMERGDLDTATTFKRAMLQIEAVLTGGVALGSLALGGTLTVAGLATLSAGVTANGQTIINTGAVKIFGQLDTGQLSANVFDWQIVTNSARFLSYGPTGVAGQFTWTTAVGGGTSNVPMTLTYAGLAVAGTLSATNIVSFTNTTDATSLTSASAVLSGGMAVTKSLLVGGNVGIRTTSPGASLEIAQPGDSVTSGLLLTRSGTSTGDIYLNSADNTLNFARGLAGAVAMSINATGNVGIGTTGPLSLLSVGGVGNASYAAYITGSVYATGSLTAGAISGTTGAFSGSAAVGGTVGPKTGGSRTALTITDAALPILEFYDGSTVRGYIFSNAASGMTLDSGTYDAMLFDTAGARRMSLSSTGLAVTGALSVTALPTTDPHVAGAFWRSTNTVMVSTG